LGLRKSLWPLGEAPAGLSTAAKNDGSAVTFGRVGSAYPQRVDQPGTQTGARATHGSFSRAQGHTAGCGQVDAGTLQPRLGCSRIRLKEARHA
jgi:hypothetical protein